MRRTMARGLAALALGVLLSACSKPKEPEPKMASGAGPDPGIKQRQDINTAGGPAK